MDVLQTEGLEDAFEFEAAFLFHERGRGDFAETALFGEDFGLITLDGFEGGFDGGVGGKLRDVGGVEKKGDEGEEKPLGHSGYYARVPRTRDSQAAGSRLRSRSGCGRSVVYAKRARRTPDHTAFEEPVLLPCKSYCFLSLCFLLSICLLTLFCWLLTCFFSAGVKVPPLALRSVRTSLWMAASFFSRLTVSLGVS